MNNTTATVINFEHPRFFAFYNLLCKVVGNPKNNKCNHHSHDNAKQVLKTHFPECDIEKSIQFFKSKGGYCDCEILMNVHPNEEETEVILSTKMTQPGFLNTAL